MTKTLAIAATELRRLLRWKASAFFLVLLPFLIILLLGAAFGGSQSARVGVLGGKDGPLARSLVADLDAQPSTDVRRYGSVGALQRAVARGDVDGGLQVPAGYDRLLLAGKRVTLSWFGRPDSAAQQLRSTIQSLADDEARVLVPARLLAKKEHLSLDAAVAAATKAASTTPRIAVVTEKPNGNTYAATTTGTFQSAASTQLLLFIFINSISGSVWLIETRRLGLARRMLSTPTPLRVIVAGQLLGRLTVALVQAAIIVLGTLLIFGVDWGNPLGTAAVIVAFSLVGTGAAVLLGSLFSSEQQAGPVATLLGLGLAALGGSMAPIYVFPHTARLIAHVTPHAWANDALGKLLEHGAGPGGVLLQVGVLLAFATALLVTATWRLQRVLTR
jgi:linearmycin/streptolysin S transport system permease protein